MSAEPIAPSPALGLGGEKIGGFAWYGRELGVEDQWQADQGAVHIEIGQRVAFGYDLRAACQRLHQIGERLLHLKNHARGALSDLGNVAAEVNGVAKTLLCVNQNGLARSLACAGPQWLREISLFVSQLIGLPSLFVFAKSAAEVAGQQQAQSGVGMGLRKVRP